MLKQLTELRETFYLLDHWFTIEGYNSGTARWKGCIGQGMGKGTNLPQSPGVHQPRSSPNAILLGFYKGFITQALLIKSLALKTLIQPQTPLDLPRGQGGGTERSNSLITWLVLMETNLPPPTLSKSHLIHMTKNTFIVLFGNSKGFRSSVP